MAVSSGMVKCIRSGRYTCRRGGIKYMGVLWRVAFSLGLEVDIVAWRMKNAEIYILCWSIQVLYSAPVCMS